jgi:hypothetical protein
VGLHRVFERGCRQWVGRDFGHWLRREFFKRHVQQLKQLEQIERGDELKYRIRRRWKGEEETGRPGPYVLPRRPVCWL